ncbi:LLM class flavin-dependent oxidoreductase [Actinophytocola sp.]|uniref:LLM class flavin-dependent oxidoreductase n=1 Tax=Actinophytocola sp. TaxID=1872138 RepID=UPI002ED28E37
MPTFGILHDFRRPGGGDYVEYYAECLAEVALADELGLDTVWLSEHHLTPDGMTPAPLVLAAAIAVRTNRIRIGTSVLVLPLHQPLRLAEEAATVDLLSGGRLVLGVGQGYAHQEFAAFGVPRRHRARLLDEGVALLREALTTGRAGTVPVTPSPLRPVPLYVGGVTEAGLRRAARLGDGVIVYCATPADLRARRAVLDTIAPDVPLVCTSVLHVAESAEQAWAEAAPGIAYLENQISGYAERAETPVLPRDAYLVGTPAEVAARLADLADELRFEHFAHWARLPGLSHERALESLRLFADAMTPVHRPAGR